MAERDDLSRFPILGQRVAGARTTHELSLPRPALQNDRWTVISITGQQPGPALFVNAGVHGAEYPAIQTVIELATELDPATVRGTVVLMPVVNVPGFWERSMFICPVDGKNPNRVFPGDPEGSYSEQLAHVLMTEFIQQADAHIDLHGGDMVEALVPFSICRRGDTDAARKSQRLAEVFGLPYLLAVDRAIQPSSGTTTYTAAVAAGVPSIIAEAGGIGQLDAASVSLLKDGVLRVLADLDMLDDGPPPAASPTVLSSFEWLYSPVAGFFYSMTSVARDVARGDIVGRIGSLAGERLADVRSPVTGKVLFLTTSPAVKEHGLLMGIGVR
ncbi:MAG TPA: succinylglutamate desuccinylase/aspartoacylase family protein [Thermomicrobiales bacterium]|nr:succinylglutamate desuccinylase/aspartoacylase family protein [Thermomicrobiales bacterium]